jgi:hypothetical protein
MFATPFRLCACDHGVLLLLMSLLTRASRVHSCAPLHCISILPRRIISQVAQDYIVLWDA